MNENYSGQYIGLEKIREIKQEEDMSVVYFKNNAVERVPTILLPRLVTKEKNDVNGASFNDLKLMGIAKDLLVLLNKAYHLRFMEVETTLRFLGNVLANDFTTATAILWQKDKTQILLDDIDRTMVKGAEDLNKIEKSLGADSVSSEIVERRKRQVMNSQG